MLKQRGWHGISLGTGAEDITFTLNKDLQAACSLATGIGFIWGVGLKICLSMEKGFSVLSSLCSTINSCTFHAVQGKKDGQKFIMDFYNDIVMNCLCNIANDLIFNYYKGGDGDIDIHTLTNTA